MYSRTKRCSQYFYSFLVIDFYLHIFLMTLNLHENTIQEKELQYRHSNFSLCLRHIASPHSKGRRGAHTVSYIHMCLDACLDCFKDERSFYVVTFYQSLKPADDSRSGGRGSTFFFLFVFLSLPFPFARVAAIPSTFAVACAGLGRRQRLHAQDLVDLAEGNQAQSVL